MNDEYIYGVRARVNAGFGLWQLAYGSKADLTEETYAAARAAMMDFKSDGGRILGVPPTVLVVPPSLESAALHPLNTETKDGGGSNPWKGTAELIVTPYVA
ncbi:Mu-like prophage major head subunit gpT family protein [Paracoccaceae bacterium Fryx2]|nr:Mu-like prophage major head subunit gpT family protein [Paracoccaceae bacterium Fryx2]